MFIFLDTNIYFNQWHLRSPQFSLLANFCNNTGAVLLVPIVVVEETRAKFEIARIELLAEVTKVSRRCEDFGLDKKTFSAISISPTYNFSDIVQAKFRHVQFLPYEKVPHGLLVEKAIHKKRPFREKEKGYRDSLMWMSLLDFLKEDNSKTPIAFINANSDDFMSSDGEKNKLHSDLIDDLKLWGIENDFLVYPALRLFNEKHIEPTVHGFDHDTFKDDFGPAFEETAEEIAIDYLNSLSLAGTRTLLGDAGYSRLGLSLIQEATWEIFEGVEDPEFLGFEKLADNKIYVRYRFNLRILTVKVGMTTVAYLTNQAVLDHNFMNVDSQGADTYMYAFPRCDFDASFTFDTTTAEIETGEIDMASIRPIRF